MKFLSFLEKLKRVKKEKIIIPCLEGHCLDNKIALITGGTSGIGYAIAKSFLKNGAHVIITGRDIRRLNAAKERLLNETSCDNNMINTFFLDLTDVDNITNKLKKDLNEMPFKINIFVNNAGVNGGKLFPDTSVAEYDEIMNTNLRGMYFFSQEIAKYLVENKIKGNILNITSSSALRPITSPYILSKWGERGLTIGMAKKYIPYGIVVNGIAPASTITPMLGKNEKSDLDLPWSPAGRYLAPEEVGNLASILVSDMGRMVVGDTLYVTGGAGIITLDD